MDIEELKRRIGVEINGIVPGTVFSVSTSNSHKLVTIHLPIQQGKATEKYLRGAIQRVCMDLKHQCHIEVKFTG